MSRSSPGRYALHEFAKNVYAVRATDAQGHSLSIAQPDPYGWTISGHHGTVIFEYTLYGDHLDGTYAAIDDSHAHLNLPATLVWARGFEAAPATLRFTVPPGSNWRAATQLAEQPDGSWSASNLEQLMDSPVEISAHAESSWNIGDRAFRLSLHHRGTDADAAHFAEMCKRIVLEEAGVFGSLPHYDNGSYTFLVDDLPWATGDGMEHRDSTVITGSSDLKTASFRQIGTVAHEFFHSWNVKRIRPRSLEPFDFERADMSGELWFAEGFTNYYGILAVRRAGFSSTDQFAAQMGSAVSAVLTAPGREVHDIIDMSRLAPFVDAARSIDPTNFPNSFISYYTYGQALALGIDLAIRRQFPGKTLDDWMRTMWREHPDIDKPYTLDDLERTLGEMVGSQEFAHDIFLRHVYGLEPLDYAQLLTQAGFVLRKAHPGTITLGAPKIDFANGDVAIAGNTMRGSSLYNAGIDTGDRITSWDGKNIKTSDELNSFVAKHKPGDRVSLQVQRRTGEEKVLDAVLTEDPTLEIVAGDRAGQPVSAAMIAFRNVWLASRVPDPANLR